MILKQIVLVLSFVVLVMIGGCTMTTVKEGDVVKVHYKGTFDNGTVFDSSEGKEPLQFTVGQHQVIPGFENAVVGMKPEEVKTIHIPAADAYGEPREDLVQQIPRDAIPENVTLEVGKELVFSVRDHPVRVRVKEFNETSVTLDMNHPLAGQDLNFEITLVEVVPQ